MGAGYWDYKNVTVEWSTPEPGSSSSSGLSPAMRSLAIALPVVVGTLAIGGLLGYLFVRKRRLTKGSAHAVQEESQKAGGMGGGKDVTGQTGSRCCDKVDELRKWSMERSLQDGSTGTTSLATSRTKSQRTEGEAVLVIRLYVSTAQAWDHVQ